MSVLSYLTTAACVLSSCIWGAVGLYKITHIERMVGVIRSHSLPLPHTAFWLSVIVELGGAALMITQQHIWLVALLWLGFLLVATPVFHGNIIENRTINYPQFVHAAKNVSIAGGLIALIVIDGTIPEYLTTGLGVLPADVISRADASCQSLTISQEGAC